MPGLGMLLAALVSLAASLSAEVISGLKPAAPPPAPDTLAPGLAPDYTSAIMNHVDDRKSRTFEPGPPLTPLDWRMSAGRVLTSTGQHRGSAPSYRRQADPRGRTSRSATRPPGSSGGSRVQSRASSRPSRR